MSGLPDFLSHSSNACLRWQCFRRRLNGPRKFQVQITLTEKQVQSSFRTERFSIWSMINWEWFSISSMINWVVYAPYPKFGLTSSLSPALPFWEVCYLWQVFAAVPAWHMFWKYNIKLNHLNPSYKNNWCLGLLGHWHIVWSVGPHLLPSHTKDPHPGQALLPGAKTATSFERLSPSLVKDRTQFSPLWISFTGSRLFITGPIGQFSFGSWFG